MPNKATYSGDFYERVFDALCKDFTDVKLVIMWNGTPELRSANWYFTIKSTLCHEPHTTDFFLARPSDFDENTNEAQSFINEHLLVEMPFNELNISELSISSDGTAFFYVQKCENKGKTFREAIGRTVVEYLQRHNGIEVIFDYSAFDHRSIVKARSPEEIVVMADLS